jgi:hypothetical protein
MSLNGSDRGLRMELKMSKALDLNSSFTLLMSRGAIDTCCLPEQSFSLARSAE